MGSDFAGAGLTARDVPISIVEPTTKPPARPGRRASSLPLHETAGWRRNGHHPVLDLAVVGEIELLDPAVEAGAGDAQELGGARLVLAGLAQGGLDQPALDLGEKLVERLDGLRGGRVADRRRRGGRGSMPAGRRRRSRASHSPPLRTSADLAVSRVDHAGQLGDVAGPVVGLNRRDGLRRESAAPRAGPLVGALQQVLGQEQQVVPALAERSKLENQNGHLVIELGPEPLALDGGLGIARSRGDHANAAVERIGEPGLEIAGQGQDVADHQARAVSQRQARTGRRPGRTVASRRVRPDRGRGGEELALEDLGGKGLAVQRARTADSAGRLPGGWRVPPAACRFPARPG